MMQMQDHWKAILLVCIVLWAITDWKDFKNSCTTLALLALIGLFLWSAFNHVTVAILAGAAFIAFAIMSRR